MVEKRLVVRNKIGKLKEKLYYWKKGLWLKEEGRMIERRLDDWKKVGLLKEGMKEGCLFEKKLDEWKNFGWLKEG